MFKLIKEDTNTIEGTMLENDKEFERELDNMLEKHKSLNPLINEVKTQQWKINTMSSNVFENTIKINDIEKKVNKIVEYLEKEQKKQK